MKDGVVLERLAREQIPQGLDHAKLEELIKDGFKKELVSDYFDNVNPRLVYVAKDDERYLGSIVMIDTEIGIPYLDKIVVAADYQKNGIGKSMWGMMKEDHPKLFWRAKPNNPITEFYGEVCEGMQKVEGWNIYWIGLNTSELKEAIEYATSRPETLKPMEILIMPHSDS
jgi:acetylglutamate kinase